MVALGGALMGSSTPRLRVALEQALAAEDDDDRTVEATVARDGTSRRIAWRARRLRDASGTATGLLLSGRT